jgi:hypothetical protein
MTVTGVDTFDVTDLGIEPIESGTSILLTGDDTDALESVFYRLLAPDSDERAVVLATDATGRAVKRTLDGVDRNCSDRATVLTCEGPDHGADVRRVEDISDLTGLGMEFSNLVAASTQENSRFRAGIFLCSTICSEVEDTRSVYRFLNSNLLTSLRRNDAIGVCAIDTSADIGSDVRSTITGMQTSFRARIDVEPTSRRDAGLTVSGLESPSETVTVTL